MSRICWWLAKRLARTLEPAERDAVLGDIAESDEVGPRALLDIAGLVLRRQAALWRTVRPWIAVAGLLAPVAVLTGNMFRDVGGQIHTLMTQGVLVESAMTPADDVVRLVCGLLLIVTWGALAVFRRTAWEYAALSCVVWWLWFVVPIRMLFAIFGLPLRQTLFGLSVPGALVLIPFLWGVHRGMRHGSPGVGLAALLAGAIALLTLILQVEDSRARLAHELWNSGASLGRQVVWTPHLLPFLAILWQFGLMTAARVRCKEENA